MSSAEHPHPLPPPPTPIMTSKLTRSRSLEVHVDSNKDAREYEAPDHTLGETWPGKQRPSTQLSLFSVGVKRN